MRACLREGTDVVIGLLDTHGCCDTAREAVGLEPIPRKRLRWQGVELEEMDVAAILARRPQLVLLDELAHTNGNSLEQQKKLQEWQANRPKTTTNKTNEQKGANEQDEDDVRRRLSRVFAGRPVWDRLSDGSTNGALESFVILHPLPILLRTR
jgi:hypothetical protein